MLASPIQLLNFLIFYLYTFYFFGVMQSSKRWPTCAIHMPQHKIIKNEGLIFLTQQTLFLLLFSTNMQVSFLPWQFANMFKTYFSSNFQLATHNLVRLIAMHIYVMRFFTFPWLLTISISTCLLWMYIHCLDITMVQVYQHQNTLY